jgi:hypothetical protein
MASEECCFATAMRHRIAVSHDRAGRKHKSSSVGAVDQTAGAGATQPRCGAGAAVAGCPSRTAGVRH